MFSPRRIPGLAVALVLGMVWAAPASAQGLTAQELSARVGIEQMLGATLPADLAFVDETGQEVRLADYLDDKPIAPKKTDLLHIQDGQRLRTGDGRAEVIRAEVFQGKRSPTIFGEISEPSRICIPSTI